MPTAPLYLDDIEVGHTFVTGSITLTADDIRAFAHQFDPQPFHLDEPPRRTACSAAWPPAAGIPPP